MAEMVVSSVRPCMLVHKGIHHRDVEKTPCRKFPAVVRKSTEGHLPPQDDKSSNLPDRSPLKTTQERSTATAEHGGPKAKHSDRNLGLDRVGHVIPDRHSSKCTVAASVSRTPRRSQNQVCGGSDSGNFPENRVQWSPPSCAPCLRAHSRYDVRYTTYKIRQTGYDIRDITTYICVKHEVEDCKATCQ